MEGATSGEVEDSSQVRFWSGGVQGALFSFLILRDGKQGAGILTSERAQK